MPNTLAILPRRDEFSGWARWGALLHAIVVAY